MYIQYKTSTMRLKEMPMDVGYASEQVDVYDNQGNKHAIGGHNKKTQLFITLPFIDEHSIAELEAIAKELPKDQDETMTSAVILSEIPQTPPEIEGLNFFEDKEEEFADFYGVKLEGMPLNNALTKALILVSKDGAIFYDEFMKDIEQGFNIPTLARKILAAQECYTGKGCH